MTSQSTRELQHNRCTQGPGIQPTGGPALVGLGWLTLFVGYATLALSCPALLSTLFYTSADRLLKTVSPNLIALWFLVRFLCSGDWQVERGRGLVFLLCFLYPLAPRSWQKLHLPSLWLLSMAQVLHGAPVTPYLLLVPSDLGVVRASSIFPLWCLWWVLSTCSHLSVVSTQNLFCSTIWVEILTDLDLIHVETKMYFSPALYMSIVG